MNRLRLWCLLILGPNVMFGSTTIIAQENTRPTEELNPMYDKDGERNNEPALEEGSAENDDAATTSNDSPAPQKTPRPWDSVVTAEDLPAFHTRQNEFSLLDDPNRKRNYLWPPLLSFVLPGLGQWVEGRYAWAGLYSGGAALGLVYGIYNAPEDQQDYESEEEFSNRRTHGIQERKSALGLQIYQTFGGLSAYHNFRTAVRSQQRHGEFMFLTEEEQISDILLAPARFDFLSRSSTYIPLGIGAAFYLLVAAGGPKMFDEDLEYDGTDVADVVFASAFSFNAGTHEEAVFRGWVQPMFMNWLDDKTWSNLATAGIFALAHVPSNPFPLPQFLLGWHMGNVTMQNRWTLAESIFIHTWWDVMAFLAQYHVRIKDNDNTVQPRLHLPPLEFHF